MVFTTFKAEDMKMPKKRVQLVTTAAFGSLFHAIQRWESFVTVTRFPPDQLAMPNQVNCCVLDRVNATVGSKVCNFEVEKFRDTALGQELLFSHAEIPLLEKC